MNGVGEEGERVERKREVVKERGREREKGRADIGG